MAQVEIAVSVESYGGRRSRRGDIIVARIPIGVIGRLERRRWLWLPIETTLSIDELRDPGNGFQKRLYEFDLDSLYAERSIDRNRVESIEDDYQPLLGGAVQSGRAVSIRRRDELRGR